MLKRAYIDSPLKTALITVFAAMLMSCGDGGSKNTAEPDSGGSKYEMTGDHALGDPNAPITVTEYASVTCPGCAYWHINVWEDFRKKFVDTGKVRFIFREFPAGNPRLAMAGHLLANCADDKYYFDMINVQFKRQQAILNDPKAEFLRLAKNVGMSEADFEACMVNTEEKARLDAVYEMAIDNGVTGTPNFFINGKLVKSTNTIEDFEKEFAKILGAETKDGSE